MRARFVCFAGLCTLFLLGQSAQASLELGFERITNNAPTNIENQLLLTIYGSADLLPFSNVSALGSNQVLFVFENAVGVNSNVAEIYLDNDPASVNNLAVLDVVGKQLFNTGGAGGLEVNNTPLVGDTRFSFSGLDPGNLPGGNGIFDADDAVSADSANGNGFGINLSTERVALLFNTNSYNNGSGLFTGLLAVKQALLDGKLQVGLHVRSIGTREDSDGFVATYAGGNEVVPEPASILVWTLVSGSCGLLGLVRRRRRSA